MKHESNPPKGGSSTAITNNATTSQSNESSCSALPKVVARGNGGSGGLVETPKSIFDISNDELMSFLSGNNESLNFLDIKEPPSATQQRLAANPDQTTTTTASERPRRTSRKAWVSE